MRVILLLLAILCAAGGATSIAVAKTDIQLILAAVFFGFAVTFFSLAWIIKMMRDTQLDIEDLGKGETH